MTWSEKLGEQTGKSKFDLYTTKNCRTLYKVDFLKKNDKN